MPCCSHSPRSRREQGVVSIEMALVTPLLLLLIAGAVNLGHYIYVRYRLADHAGAAARACALSDVNSQKCADNAWARVKKEVKSCGWLRVRVQRRPLTGLEDVKGLKVSMECRYNVGIARSVLNKEGVTFQNIHVAALMPY